MSDGHVYNGGGFSTFVSFQRDPARDPEDRSTTDTAQLLQLEYVLKRFPHLREHAPEQPVRLDAFNIFPSPQERRKYIAPQQALLRDPAPVRSAPTKPVAKPEPPISLYRRAVHEVFTFWDLLRWTCRSSGQPN